ncbi:ion channel [bacterium]|nr:ion channel [bacterium]
MIRSSIQKQRFRFSSLLFSMVLVMFCSPFLLHGTVSSLIRAALICYLLTAAALAASTRSAHLRAIISLAILGLCSQIALTVSPSPLTFTLFTSISTVFLAFISILLFLQVFQTEEVTSDSLFGAICVYLLIGITFCFLYSLIEFAIPGSFSFTREIDRTTVLSSPEEIQNGISTFFYYSFVTLTTLGYGDITPLSPIARNISILESIAGQFYLTILVARLVALHLTSD